MFFRLFFCAVLVVLSCRSWAQEFTFDSLISGVVGADSIKLKSLILKQTDEAMSAARFSRDLLTEQRQAIRMEDFQNLYMLVIKLPKLERFKIAIEGNNPKDALLSYLRKAKNNINCKLSESNFISKNNDKITKVSVSCPASYYGDSHWIDSQRTIRDTYYFSQTKGGLALEDFEFGLIFDYHENIEIESVKINKYLNE